MESLLATFAKNLRRVRRKLGITQDELAYRANLHRTYVGAIERGERNVSLRNVEKLATALGVDPYTLLQETDTDE